MSSPLLSPPPPETASLPAPAPVPEGTAESTEASNETPRAAHHAQYVFKVLNHRRATSSLCEPPAKEDPSPCTAARSLHLQEIHEQLKRPASKVKEGALEGEGEEARRQGEESLSLRAAVRALSTENAELRARNEELAAGEGRSAALEAEIQRIKDEYVQTSLDCFQESLRPQLEQVIALRALLETQGALRESLQASLSEAHSHNQYLAGELKAKGEIFERELRSQRQRFEVQLSDRDNQIHNLKNSLATLQQRYGILASEVRAKDEFLLRLGHAKQ